MIRISVKKPNFDKVYSIMELAQKFGCGKSTAQKVLETLAKDNILVGMRGVGFFVNRKDEHLQERLRMEYEEAIKQTFDDYLCLCRNIGMTEEDIKKHIETRLKRDAGRK